AAAGMMAFEAGVRVGAASGPGKRVPAAGRGTTQPRKIVHRYGGAIRAGIPLPEIIVGTLRGQTLAGGNGVACAIGDACESHRLAVVDVEHAAERAGRTAGAAIDVEHCPLFPGPSDSRLSGYGRPYADGCLGRELHAGVAADAVIVAEAGEIIRN